MTLLAFGGKCGFFGASGFESLDFSWANTCGPQKSEAKAILPKPTAQSEKKCRRVWSRVGFISYSRVMNSSRFKRTRATAVHAASVGTSYLARAFSDTI